MTDNDYFWPGIAAIALAAIYPIFWIYEIGFGDMLQIVIRDGDVITNWKIDLADWVFLGVGALTIYIHYSLMRILGDHHNYHGIDILLIVQICLCVIFYAGLFATDVILVLAGDQLSSSAQNFIVVASASLFLGFIIITGLMEILIGIMLLREPDQLPSLMRIFAISTLILGIFDLSVIFAAAAIFIFPMTLIILAMRFLQRPQMIEVA